jgi:hypothetical protein
VSTRLTAMVIDSADPPALARWWARALGWEITYESPGETCVEVAAHQVGATPPELTFVRGTAPRTGPVGLHLDLATTTSSHQRDTVDGLLDAGAHHADVGQPRNAAYVVLADPEGNEFCVLEPRAEYAGTGPVAALVLGCTDPPALAPFWEAASGWLRVDGNDRLVRLRHPAGTGPYLELIRVLEQRPEKLRQHLDVAPFADDDQAAEVERLVSLGARRIDVGQLDTSGARLPGTTWEVLTDPDGHEFCVLSPR